MSEHVPSIWKTDMEGWFPILHQEAEKGEAFN